MSFWGSFWSVSWYGLVIFALIASLMALFAVVMDLVRDRQLGGWWKALWVLFLVFFRFITVFVHLIVRGQAMAERTGRAQQAVETYVRQVAGRSEEIANARAVLERGATTPNDYEAARAQVLGQWATPTPAPGPQGA